MLEEFSGAHGKEGQVERYRDSPFLEGFPTSDIDNAGRSVLLKISANGFDRDEERAVQFPQDPGQPLTRDIRRHRPFLLPRHVSFS
jgi:hypothetical protein